MMATASRIGAVKLEKIAPTYKDEKNTVRWFSLDAGLRWVCYARADAAGDFPLVRLPSSEEAPPRSVVRPALKPQQRVCYFKLSPLGSMVLFAKDVEPGGAAALHVVEITLLDTRSGSERIVYWYADTSCSWNDASATRLPHVRAAFSDAERYLVLYCSGAHVVVDLRDRQAPAVEPLTRRQVHLAMSRRADCECVADDGAVFVAVPSSDAPARMPAGREVWMLANDAYRTMRSVLLPPDKWQFERGCVGMYASDTGRTLGVWGTALGEWARVDFDQDGGKVTAVRGPRPDDNLADLVPRADADGQPRKKSRMSFGAVDAVYLHPCVRVAVRNEITRDGSVPGEEYHFYMCGRF